MKDIARWFIRVPFAATFLYHGIGKFPALEKTSAVLDLPVPLVVLVAIAEVLAGVGAIVGGLPMVKRADLVTRLSGLAAAPAMLGAIAMVHLHGGRSCLRKVTPWAAWNFKWSYWASRSISCWQVETRADSTSCP